MSSQLLRAADYRTIARISHECRDLGNDPHAWRTHLAEQLNQSVQSDLIFVVEMGGFFDGHPYEAGVTEWGWQNGFDRTGWTRGQDLFRENPAYGTLLNAMFARLGGTVGATHARSELVDHATWDGSVEREQVFKVLGVDHTVYSFFTLAAARSDHAGLMCCRATGRKDFSARERAFIDETQRSFALLVGRSLARFHEPSANDLTERVREVLQCLLEGDGDKQIAKRLHISGYTVNQYTKTIYAHFGVRGRAELLARWVRRCWGRGFDPPAGR